MVTCNPADALNWEERIGRLQQGLHGDVVVTTDRGPDPSRNLVTSVERDVQFVAINGDPFYGTNKLMKAAGATPAEPIRIGRLRRSIVLKYPGIKDADMGWAQVLEPTSRGARRDPIKRYLEIEQLHAVGKPPPWLMTDKPWDNPQITGQEVPVAVQIPPPDALVPNGDYFEAVKRSPLHGGMLDGLRDYYVAG